jgi:hypothetical protein
MTSLQSSLLLQELGPSSSPWLSFVQPPTQKPVLEWHVAVPEHDVSPPWSTQLGAQKGACWSVRQM